MILFCEECGKKNTLGPPLTRVLNNGFICLYCGSKTPSSSLKDLLPNSIGQKEKQSNIVWSPNPISFGTIDPGERAVRRVIFHSKDNIPIDIAAELTEELQSDLKIIKVNNHTLEIHLLPVSKRTLHKADFMGRAVIFYDKNSDFSTRATIKFTREVPLLRGIPSEVNLGNIRSGERYYNYLVAENRGNQTLRLQLKPDPKDFIMSARFVIDRSLAVTVAPGGKIKIPFCLWPDDEIPEDMPFSQQVRVTTNEPGKITTKNVVIQGKILASST